MDKDLDLNTSGVLPDRTAATQSGGFGASASERRRGYTDASVAADPYWTADPSSPTALAGVKSKSPDEVGGFCGRPQGWQR